MIGWQASILKERGLMKDQPANTQRRDFLKTAGGAAAGAIAAGFPGIISGQTVTNAIKVGLVGCGGRGSGAASQALAADDYAELTAVADIDQAQIDHCLQSLKRIAKSAARVKVETATAVSGSGRLSESDRQQGGRGAAGHASRFPPAHLAACIAANKHVFCEKPISTDAPGVRSVLQTADKAKQKNLSLVAGFCWRYNNMIQDTFQQVENGAIGRLVAYYATYYTSPVKPMPPASTRPAGMSDVEWQIRNWYNFVWLCGDSIVEQAVHSVDKIAWAMHDEPPVSCVGVGGRTIPAEGGNIYDHFEINYLYPNGVRAFLANRQIVGCYNENSDYMLGTEGTCTIGRGPFRASRARPTGRSPASSTTCTRKSTTCCSRPSARTSRSMMASGWRPARCSAIMGRMAAYTGQQVTWDQAMNSQEKLVPEQLDWNGSLEVRPRAEPGVTKLI